MGGKGLLLTLVSMCVIVSARKKSLLGKGLAPLKLLRDGNMIPRLAVGVSRGTAIRVDKNEVRFAVYWAVGAGYRHIDTTASFLGEDEQQVGLGIADVIKLNFVKREDLFVTTKLPNTNHHRDQVVPTLQGSLRRLGLTYVDLYLIHWPLAFVRAGEEDIDYLETWQGMEDAKELGLTKSIGVANFNAMQIDRLMNNSRIKPVVNQIEVNPTMTQESLVNHCHKNNIVVEAYCPFGYIYTKNYSNIFSPKSLVYLARKYGKTVGQIALRYLIDRDLVVVPKTATRERLEQNIDLFDFQLTDDEIHTINRINKNIRVNEPFGWQDLPNYPFERYVVAYDDW